VYSRLRKLHYVYCSAVQMDTEPSALVNYQNVSTSINCTKSEFSWILGSDIWIQYVSENQYPPIPTQNALLWGKHEHNSANIQSTEAVQHTQPTV